MKYVNIRIRRNSWIGRKVGDKYYKSYTQQRDHDLRTELMQDGYLSRSENIGQNINTNFQEIEEKNVKHFWLIARDDYLDRWGRGLPKNTKPIISGLISFSPDMVEDIHTYGKELLNKKVNQFLTDKFGKSCIYNSLQMEEGTPHFQWTMINYDFKTHRTISNTIDTSILQTEIANFLKKEIEGFDYVRGIPKEISHAEHMEVRQSQQIAMKKQEIHITEKEVQIQQLKNAEIDHQRKIKNLEEQSFSINKNIEESKKEIQELQDRLTSIIEDIIELGEEQKGKTMLSTMKKYVINEKSYKLEQLIKKADRTKKALKNNINPGGT